MGVSWSKEEDVPGGSGNPLDKETMIYILKHFESLDDLASVSMVNRWWSVLLASDVVPEALARMQLKAWYHTDSIRAFRASSAPPGVEACSAWFASPRGVHHLLRCFPFPETVRSRLPADCATPAVSALTPWACAPARGCEPRVVASAFGPKCVQFVDLAGRHPVHLRSRAFAQPLQQPVTLFCVGIAFEDATFVSGLNARFEVCHAYPTADQPEHERAPVSITAHPVGDSSDSDDDPSPGAIVSGSTQPGAWHVYTAVFNGDSSSLFVDGVREGDASAAAGGLKSASGGGGTNVGTNVGTGLLDGLTLGADHRNDFPLGSMIEGTVPGAVAELVVFNSVLTAADRTRIECKLMRDHGIDLPSNARDLERARAAQAHAMITSPPSGRPYKQLPLRYLTRHNDVRWQIPHPVTGDKIRPKRIGVRETDVSSGWDD